MENQYEQYVKSNISFSGTDIAAVINIPGVGNYVIGSLQTVSYSTHQEKRPVRSIGNINAKDYVMGQRTIAGSLIFTAFDKHIMYKIMDKLKVNRRNILADEIPPFNIILTFANEYGNVSSMTIYGVEIINEGQVMSINDIYTENTYQYVARYIDYMDNNFNKNFVLSNTRKQIIITTKNKNIEVKNKDIKKPLNKVKKNTDINIHIKLHYSIKKNNNKYNVSFKLQPVQTEGYIYVYSNKNKYKLNVNSDNNMNILLNSGIYEAIYINDKKKSNNVYISIAERQEQHKKLNPPIIESLTYNRIKIKPKNEDKLIIVKLNEDIKRSIKNNTNIPIIIDNLNMNTMYSLYSKNEDISYITKFETTKNEIFDRNKLKEMLFFNINLLNDTNINNYYIIIDKINDLINNNECISIFEKLIYYYLNNKDSLENNKILEIINIIQDLYNSNIYYLNNKFCENIIEHYPTIVGKLQNIFSTNNKIEKVEIYEFKNNKYILKKIITEFINENNNEKIFKYNCRPNTLYKIYGIDYSKNYTSPLYYFNQTDEKKIINFNKNNKYNEYSKNILNDSKRILSTMINLNNYSKKEQEILIAQNSLNIDTPIVQNLKLKKIKKLSFTLEYDSLFKLHNRILVCICDKDNIHKNSLIGKILINPTKEITINSTIYPIENNKDYFVWMEDINQEKISNSIYINLNENNTKINNVFEDKRINKIYELLKEENIPNNIIDNMKTNINTNENNLLNNLLKNIVENNNILYPCKILFNAFKVIYNQLGKINEQFFESFILQKDNVKQKTSILNYNTEYIYIDNDNNIYSSNKYELKNKKYIFIYSIDSMNIKSGFALLDCRTKEILNYKLNAKGEM